MGWNGKDAAIVLSGLEARYSLEQLASCTRSLGREVVELSRFEDSGVCVAVVEDWREDRHGARKELRTAIAVAAVQRYVCWRCELLRRGRRGLQL